VDRAAAGVKRAALAALGLGVALTAIDELLRIAEQQG